jgi:hypothetical protein
MMAGVAVERDGDPDLRSDLELAAVRLDEASARLRSEAVRVLEVRAWAIVRGNLRRRYDELLALSKQTLRTDLVRASALPRETEDYFEKHSGSVPADLRPVIERAMSASRELRKRQLSGARDGTLDRACKVDLEALVVALLEIELWEPVEVVVEP